MRDELKFRQINVNDLCLKNFYYEYNNFEF